MTQSTNKNIGIFLIHGITKTNKELEPVKTYLEKDKKIKVYLPLLPGHGTCPYSNETCLKHFWETTPDKWLANSEKGFNSFRKGFKKIYVGGISIGGSIALFIAAKYKVDGVILFGTPIFLSRILSFAYSGANIALWIINKINKKFKRKKLSGQYHGLPIAKLMRIKLLVDESRKKLPQIRSPVIIFHSKKDDMAHPKSADYLMKNLGSRHKELVWVNSLHGIDVNSKSQARFVSSKIINFVKSS